MIRHALAISKIEDKSQAIMIGDRNYDILGAKENGLDSMGVLFGFGDYEEFVRFVCGVLLFDYIAENIQDILKYV